MIGDVEDVGEQIEIVLFGDGDLLLDADVVDDVAGVVNGVAADVRDVGRVTATVPATEYGSGGVGAAGRNREGQAVGRLEAAVDAPVICQVAQVVLAFDGVGQVVGNPSGKAVGDVEAGVAVV